MMAGRGKLLVANRGEIAVRVIRAARELGLATVQVYSKADAGSLAVRLADEAVEIGPPQAAKSYLRIEAILEAAQATGATAVHPGYGFLAENAGFADAVEAAGLIWIGPSGQAIRLMGDKVAARSAAHAVQVPTVPGSEGHVSTLEEAAPVIRRTGFPVMIKAAAGGGGRGIRIARNEAEFERLLPQASTEAQAAFGDGGLYIEKLIERARHVEVQILGDGQHVIHLYERECSLQRRRQKVWEEAPSPALPPEVRERLCASAVALAAAVNYRGAGTLEYLYDDATGAFYFIEMNTRIQVEHPVTEMVTGVDLVREQLLIAAGRKLSIRQEDIVLNGHAIECRINAEDPESFLPCPGLIKHFHAPGGPGVRVDTHIYEGYRVPSNYDSMVGKLIVHGADRAQAIARMRVALSEMVVDGIRTNVPLQQRIMADQGFQTGGMNIHYLEKRLNERKSKAIGLG